MLRPRPGLVCIKPPRSGQPPASPPKPASNACSPTTAPACCASTDPYIRERLHDLDDLGQPADAPTRGPGSRATARAVAGQRHPGGPLDGARRRCSTTTARKIRGLILEEGGANLARRYRGARARHSPRWARSTTCARYRRVPAMPSLSTARPAIVLLCGRPPTSRSAYAERVKLQRPPPGAICAHCATGRASPRTASRWRTDDQRRPRWSICRTSPTPAAGGIGLFRTELQFMIATRACRASADQLSLYRSVLDAAGRQAGDVSHPRHRWRQDPALHAPPRPRKIPALGWRAIRLGLDRPGLMREPNSRAPASRRRARVEGHVPDGRRTAPSSTKPRSHRSSAS